MTVFDFFKEVVVPNYDKLKLDKYNFSVVTDMDDIGHDIEKWELTELFDDHYDFTLYLEDKKGNSYGYDNDSLKDIEITDTILYLNWTLFIHSIVLDLDTDIDDY